MPRLCNKPKSSLSSPAPSLIFNRLVRQFYIVNYTIIGAILSSKRKKVPYPKNVNNISMRQFQNVSQLAAAFKFKDFMLTVVTKILSNNLISI